MDIAKFNSAFSDADHRRRTEPDFDVAGEQNRLRGLLSEEDPPADREWASELIESLAEPPPPPRQWSSLYDEAGQIHASAYVDGTTGEKIAALESARCRIWEIADRAPQDEAPHIRAMTRVLEHLENELRDPSWPLDERTTRTD
ncbi:hypothetical protein FB561_7437 [Kribbella amoyensis]|uniref:Uncharacterized protein n=1 Tax=Kribbella amoyensis TaxID=996641 RepID=A0A561B0Q5_9ACTN|nr:hypothetical protein [Kribbella amoyensis]TWD72445.1 hypothetical protein FB561_7437 [Kribbella amoyensis]